MSSIAAPARRRVLADLVARPAARSPAASSAIPDPSGSAADATGVTFRRTRSDICSRNARASASPTLSCLATAWSRCRPPRSIVRANTSSRPCAIVAFVAGFVYFSRGEAEYGRG